MKNKTTQEKIEEICGTVCCIAFTLIILLATVALVCMMLGIDNAKLHI